MCLGARYSDYGQFFSLQHYDSAKEVREKNPQYGFVILIKQMDGFMAFKNKDEYEQWLFDQEV